MSTRPRCERCLPLFRTLGSSQPCICGPTVPCLWDDCPNRELLDSPAGMEHATLFASAMRKYIAWHFPYTFGDLLLSPAERDAVVAVMRERMGG